MNPRHKTFSLLVLAYFSAFVTNGNTKFGDYLKRRPNNINHTVNGKTTNTTSQNDHFHKTPQHQQPTANTLRRENFEIGEVRVYGTNPSPMYQNREKKMLESLFPDNALQPGQDFDLRKQIYGPDLKKEFDSLLERTSPNWDQLQALLKKADKITRLPQSMYYDEEEARKPSNPESRNIQADPNRFGNEKNSSKKEDLSLGAMFKRQLQMPASMYDLSMDFGGGHQVYPFKGDLSLSDAIFRNKREIKRDDNFPRYPPDRRTVNYQPFRQPRQSYFRGPPPAYQFPGTNRFTYNSFRPEFHLGKDYEATKFYVRSSYELNSRNYNFTRIIRDSNFPQISSDKSTVNYQSFRQPRELHFSGPPSVYQFPRTSKFVYNSFGPNLHPGKENEARKVYVRSSFRQNLKIDNFTGMYYKITSKITKLTPHGTFDATWKEVLQQMNPIQQKIIQDLFLYGPPTSMQTTRTSLSTCKVDRKQINSSLITSSSSLSSQNSTSFSTLKFRVREIDKRSTPGIQNTSKNLFTYDQLWVTRSTSRTQSSKLSQNSTSFSSLKFRIREIDKRSTPGMRNTSKKLFTYDQLWITKSTSPTYTSPKLRPSVTIDKRLMKEWLKSLNPQDHEEMENLFFNGQSPPYDINDVESIKNALKNEFLQGSIKTRGGFSTNNPKSTFISRKGNKNRQAEDIGLGYYNYEDLSRLLKQAPQDKLKIVDDWCDEIKRDLHRRFPTGTTKYGETRKPFYPTRYYPWELFSMLPNQN